MMSVSDAIALLSLRVGVLEQTIRRMDVAADEQKIPTPEETERHEEEEKYFKGLELAIIALQQKLTQLETNNQSLQLHLIETRKLLLLQLPQQPPPPPVPAPAPAPALAPAPAPPAAAAIIS